MIFLFSLFPCLVHAPSIQTYGMPRIPSREGCRPWGQSGLATQQPPSGTRRRTTSRFPGPTFCSARLPGGVWGQLTATPASLLWRPDAVWKVFFNPSCLWGDEDSKPGREDRHRPQQKRARHLRLALCPLCALPHPDNAQWFKEWLMKLIGVFFFSIRLPLQKIRHHLSQRTLKYRWALCQ